MLVRSIQCASSIDPPRKSGKLIQENIEMDKNTPGSVDGKEKAKGPLMFRGNHGPVAYRPIVIKPLPKK